MNTTCTFYIVRHGETESNKARMLMGHKETTLTELGKTQAKELGEILASIHFDRVYSSDLIRAKHTAELIVLEKKLAVETTRLLRELTYGPFDGRPLEEYLQVERELLDKWEKSSLQEKKNFSFHPEVETYASSSLRFITFLREVAVAYPGNTILVVSHSMMMRSLLIELGAATFETLPPSGVKNTSYIKLTSDGVTFDVLETAGISLTLQTDHSHK